MTEPAEIHRTISFVLTPNDDKELTCVVCWPTSSRLCELEFSVGGDGKRTGIGVHEKCVERLYQRNPHPALAALFAVDDKM